MAKLFNSNVAIIGAGLGGTAAAALLQQAGYTVRVYEQTDTFSRLGAGIHLGPNVTRVLRKIGIEPYLRKTGMRPAGWVNRLGDTGEISFDLVLGDDAQTRYGSPYLILHRGDFHAALLSASTPGTIEFGKRLSSLEQSSSGVRLSFADGTAAHADWVVGADGVNSMVREILLGPEKPTYTGYVAHRSILPSARIGDLKLDDCTKWWSRDRHIVVYYLTAARDELYFVTGVPMAKWNSDATWVPGDMGHLRDSFIGFEPRVQRVLDACTEVSTWAILDRPPLPLWSRGRIVLLGDACHPMKPHMGQGAAIAIEDAAMLVRCLEQLGASDLDAVFGLYRTNRIDRTSKVQTESHKGEWLRQPTDPSWVYGYNVFNVPLVSAS